MVEIADIKDRDSLKNWLEDRSKEECIQIATRAALRVLPLFWEWSLTEPAKTHDLATLAALRCFSISRITGQYSIREIAFPAADAFFAAAARSPAAAAAKSAADAVLARAAFPAARAAAAADKAARPIAAIFEFVRSDCLALTQTETKLASLPLWHDAENPLQCVWREVKKGASEQPEIWAYWIQWYEDILAGNTANWPLEQKIARIDSKVWDLGPVAVSEEIRRLQEQIDLLNEARAMREENERPKYSFADAKTRSHNMPPGLVDAPKPMRREIIFIWEQIEDAETELVKSKPDMRRLRMIGLAIRQSFSALTQYASKIVDQAIVAGAKAIGAGGGTLALDHFLNNGRLLAWVERLLQFAS